MESGERIIWFNEFRGVGEGKNWREVKLEGIGEGDGG